jgi:hypothetical protein
MRHLPNFAKTLMILIFSLVSMNLIAQSPTYSCVATNDIQINANTYQFDVYIYRTGITDLYLNNYQLSFQITNSALILNGGTLSGSYVGGSSQLPSAWTPPGVTVYTSNPRKIRINGLPASSNGTLIPTTGLRIGTFQITNNVPFGQASMGLTWWNATPAFTLVYAIVPPAATGPAVIITNMASHTTSLTDPILNGTPTAPVIGAITQPTCALPTGSVELSGLPATGQWTVTASPGGATFISSGSTTSFSGLTPNTYTFTVTNSSGLTSPASANVVINAVPNAPAAPAATLTQPTCAVPTGTILVTAPLGVNLEYSKDATIWQTSTTFSLLPAGASCRQQTESS